MAEDCETFLASLARTAAPAAGAPVLLGHSMGGRVAMHLALRRADAIGALVVVDASTRPGMATEPRAVLEALLAINPSAYTERSDVGAALAPFIGDASLRASLLMNLEKGVDGVLRWRIGLQEIADGFERLGDPLPDGLYRGRTLFLRGGRSGYLPPSQEESVKASFPNAEIVTIADAGHLPHIDQPDEFLRVLAGFLDRE
jgi:pimeloyl-ACP methyl ester carboxylesterase